MLKRASVKVKQIIWEKNGSKKETLDPVTTFMADTDQ